LVGLEADSKKQESSEQNSSGTYFFSLEPNGVLKFHSQRIYFGEQDPPQWSTAVEDLIEQAQAAKAQRRTAEAIAAYRRVGQIEPKLNDWANVGIAAAKNEAGEPAAMDEWTKSSLGSSDAETPTGLPVALIACAYLDSMPSNELAKFIPFIESTLARLREGHWWLSYDERRFYDDQLRRILDRIGRHLEEDPELNRLAATERVIRATPPAARDASPFFEATQTRGVLIAWSSGETKTAAHDGFAVSEEALSAMLDTILPTLLVGQSFSAEVRDANGRGIWGNLQGKPTASEPLHAARGLEIAFSGLTGSRWFNQKQLMWLAFILVLIAMMIAGLAMTARMVRREVELGQLQNEFIAAVSHEFKSPIASIRLLMERMKTGKVRDAQTAADYYAAIDRESERLERLVNRLLEWQQIQAGRKRYEFSLVSPAEITRSAVEQMRPQAEAKNIAFSLDVQQTGEITLDDAAITDAIQNLIDNAIKYSPAGTKVFVSCASRDHQVEIEVHDQGVGIAEDELPHIFDRFYRGRRGDMTNVHGTGLGLALVKATVEAHGGTVQVNSKPGVGSCFRLRLPIASEPGAVAMGSSASTRLVDPLATAPGSDTR
jgi:signal transduction histidine kinase